MLVAASEGHTDVVSKLLREGADLQVKNIHDKTAIFLAAEENRVDTLKVCSIHFIAGLHAQPMLTLITIIYYTCILLLESQNHATPGLFGDWVVYYDIIMTKQRSRNAGEL